MEEYNKRAADCTWRHKSAAVAGASLTAVKNSTWGVVAEIMSKGETHAFAVVGKWGACMLLLKHADTLINQPMSLLLLLSVLIMPKLFEQIVEFKLNGILGVSAGAPNLSNVLATVKAKLTQATAPVLTEEAPK